MTTFVPADLTGFFAGAVLVAAGVLALDELDELDELLPQPATMAASAVMIKIADIFFTARSFRRRRHGRSRIAAT
ncbi:MAG: hypothetical protein ACLP50_06795 [Solirubrobacteraceae bacterium]